MFTRKSMKKGLLIAVLGMTSLVYGAENKTGEDELMTLLSVSKFYGGCGIINQMVEFQRTTKMPGGDQFIERFANTEAARLGMTFQEYSNLCVQADRVYKKYSEFSDDID